MESAVEPILDGAFSLMSSLEAVPLKILKIIFINAQHVNRAVPESYELRSGRKRNLHRRPRRMKYVVDRLVVGGFARTQYPQFTVRSRNDATRHEWWLEGGKLRLRSAACWSPGRGRATSALLQSCSREGSSLSAPFFFVGFRDRNGFHTYGGTR